MRGPPRPVVFRRAETFYVLNLPDDDDLAAHAACNPGTLRIEDLVGNTLWPSPPKLLPTDGASRHATDEAKPNGLPSPEAGVFREEG